jgi:predicted transposase YbfD/YdcC
VVLGQVGVADKTDEIGAAQDFLLALTLAGRVVTADALLTQRELARTLLRDLLWWLVNLTAATARQSPRLPARSTRSPD